MHPPEQKVVPGLLVLRVLAFGKGQNFYQKEKNQQQK
jgi:hypothetical protein